MFLLPCESGSWDPGVIFIFPGNLSVSYLYYFMSHAAYSGVVSDHQNGSAIYLVYFFQQYQDFLCCFGVQCTRWFIAEQQLRVLYQSTGYGAALLLASGKLGREFIPVFRESQYIQEFRHGQRYLRQIAAYLNVFLCGEIGYQIIKLEYKPQGIPAVIGQPFRLQAGDFFPIDMNLPAVYGIETAYGIQKSGFAGTGRTENYTYLSPVYQGADPVQDFAVAPAFPIAFCYITYFYLHNTISL